MASAHACPADRPRASTLLNSTSAVAVSRLASRIAASRTVNSPAASSALRSRWTYGSAAPSVRRQEPRLRSITTRGPKRYQRIENSRDIVVRVEETAGGDEFESRVIVAMLERRTLDEEVDPVLAQQAVARELARRVDVEPLARQVAELTARPDETTEPRRVIRERLGGAKHEQVGGLAEPDLYMREHGTHVPHDPGNDRERQLIELYPLAEDAVIREASSHDVKEFRRVQRGDPGDPGIRRLRHDHIEAVILELHRAACVVGQGRHSSHVQDSAVDVVEQAVHG